MLPAYLIFVLLILSTNGFMKVGRKRETDEYQMNLKNEHRKWSKEKRRSHENLPKFFLAYGEGRIFGPGFGFDVIRKLRNVLKKKYATISNI